MKYFDRIGSKFNYYLCKLKEYFWSAGFEVDRENRTVRLFFYAFIILTLFSMVIMVILLICQ